MLPDHEPSAEVEEANKDGSACNTDSHPGAKVAAMAAAIDDGLGAFRPSTSFNDLSTLLPGNSHDGTAGRQPASSDNGNHQETEQQPPIIQSQPAQQPSDVPHTAKPATATTKRKDETVVAPNKALKANATATPKSAPPATVAAAKANLAANAKAAAVKVTNTSAPNPLTNVKSEPMPSKTLSTNTKAAAPADSRESAAKMGSKAAKPDTAASAPQASSKPAATEADFKSVAQAAISSLIQSTKTGEASKDNGRKIDTSTKHIKALTGNNWVAACSGAVPVVSSAASTSSADSKANAAKPKRQNMTADERARQNRDRNREHARNTRLRKKAYVEELKKTLTELVAQRDRAELEQRQASQREAEQREVRFRVIEEFLRLRGSNETSVARWSAILVDGFTLTLPATDFQEILYGEPEVGHGAAIKLEQVLSSVSEVMAEANDFATFLQALGKGEEKNNENDSVEFVYHCDRANFFMDGSNAVLDWTANSVGAIKKVSNL